MQFKFPQFIEVEDKIFGPLTFKQFLYIGGSVGVGVVFFTFLPKFFAFLLAVPILCFGAALAFYKVNNRPFMFTVEAFFKYMTKEKLYVWRKAEKTPEAKAREIKEGPVVPLPKLSDSKLKNMSFTLDVAKGEEGNGTPTE